MAGCFTCFSAPRVSGSASSGKGDQTRPSSRAPSDRLAAKLLKASKAGPPAVLAAAEEIKNTKGLAEGLHEASARSRAAAVNCCIDVLLSPLLEVVESLVGKPGKGGEAGWDGLQLSDLLKMARLADEEHQGDGAGRGMSSIAEGVKSLLESLLLLWDSFCSLSAGDVPIDVATGFHNQSSNKLMGMVAVVLGRRVTHEAQSVWRKRMADWRALAQALGLGGPGLPVTLSPSNKALLAYLRNAADVGEKKVSLKVHRSTALWEIAQNLWETGMAFRQTGPAKVFPLFRTDPGSNSVEEGEGHGPRKEFFIACGSCMVLATQDRQGAAQSWQPPFVYKRSAGEHWLNVMLQETPDNRCLLWTTGWLMAQAICNRSTLGIPLPKLLFQILLQDKAFRPTVEMLAAFDPEAANSLKNVAKLSKADFEAMTELEDCSGMSREQYLRHAVAAALGIGGESGWMVENLRSGFWSVIARELLEEMRVAQGDLMEMICGAEATGSRSSQFDVQHVFRVVLDEELEGSSKAASPLASALWEVVGTWPADLRRQFVLFVTGSDRLPLPGTELLRVELPFVAISSKDHMQMLGMLPQAHTCENILELPNYWEALMRTQHPSKSDPSELSSKERQKLYERLRAVLDERLRLAVTSCNSYGLDEGVGAAEGIRSSLTGLNSDGSLPGISMLPAQAERQLAPMTESYAMDHGAALSTSSSRSIDSEPEAEQIMPLREKDWGAQRSLHMPTNGTGNILAGPSSSMPSIRSEGGGEKNVPAFLGGLLEEPSEISVWANLNTPKSQSAGHKEELHPVKPGPRGFLPAFNASMPNHLRGPKNYQGSGDADTMELDVGGRNNRPGPDRIMMPASHGRGGTSSKPAAGRNNFLEAGLPGMANEALVSPSAYRRPDRSNRGMSTDGFGLSSTGFTGNKAKQGVITIDDLMNDLGV